jgi:hypothetical protein
LVEKRNPPLSPLPFSHEILGLNLITGFDVEQFKGSCAFGSQRGLHLHSFKLQNDVAFCELLTRCRNKSDDKPRHRCSNM